MAISDYSTTRDSNASIAPGDLRSNDYRRDQQIINAIRQLMADLAAFTGGTAVFATPFQIKNAGITVFVVPADSNGGIELGRTDGNTSTPFIDFHAGATVVDRDARIICVTGTGSNDGGELQIAATPLSLSKGQLKFPATQNASSDANTLDDYEEGTWTPVWKGSGTAGAFTYSHQQGAYIKIGQLVYWMCALRVTAISTAPTGDLAIIGLPFTPSYSPFFWSGFGVVSFSDIVQAGITSWSIMLDGNFPIAATDQVRISGFNGAGGALNVQLLAASLAVNSFFICSGVYRSAS